MSELEQLRKEMNELRERLAIVEKETNSYDQKPSLAFPSFLGTSPFRVT
jgi:hypothetical protein